MHNQQREDMKQLARQWRKENPKYQAGVVLIWEGAVYGWKNSIRDAVHERPGAIGVDEKENIYLAEGGNDYDGAKGWVVV